ncbi:MAG TPA: hydrogenase formation protein HypD [Spirochaetia bacterium]|nr:hydrogenase formation protein HypD [Spirochaetia bacterium]
MRYLEEFRNKNAARSLTATIRELAPERPRFFMEICGGHTLTAVKFGLHGLLPETLTLKSGPGCPVCVTSQEYIDTALLISREPGVIMTSFGDMMRVPGSSTSLLKEKAAGRDIRICLSPRDAVRIAAEHPDRQVVFLGIGFETTAPTVAMAVKEANARGLSNFTVFSALKTMPEAMRALLSGGKLTLDGFICPGHVTAVTGTRIYEPITREFGTPCVVSGFEPTDMLAALVLLLQQLREGRADVEIQYTRVVRPEGNPFARGVLEEVFQPADAAWRGLGTIPGSGLAFTDVFRSFDAASRFQVAPPPAREHPGCRCGEIMRGTATPEACPLFKKSCTPENPIGACMVSAEGACGIYYRYAG